MLKAKLFAIFIILIALLGCVIQHETTAEHLVAELRKDNLYQKFEGYGVTPRDENIYLFSRSKEPGIYHWINYSKNGTQIVDFNKLITDSSNDTIAIFNTDDSLNILKKSYELITILKDLNIRWGSGEKGYFQFLFNDSVRLTYVENRNDLDSSFYQLRDSLRWIDDNFAVHY